MKMYRIIVSFLSCLLLALCPVSLCAQDFVTDSVMQEVYQGIKTPYKYGLVITAKDSSKMVDSPSVFRYRNKWYMTYVVFDGKGYETWLAKSKDLLHWKTLGRILSFTNGSWDANQKAGYIALQDCNWGGTYEIEKFRNKYWMSYLGGLANGYEAGILKVGIANSKNPVKINGWQTIGQPVISPNDSDVRWYDNQTIYKSTIIRDRGNTLGHPFVMFYNAKGSDLLNGKAAAERIAMAVSDDIVNWKRYGEQPVIDHKEGISGDAFISRINNIWVMFYFGAFWKPGAFNRFACSYDLVNWTDWEGDDLICPSEPYDSQFAHKPYVVKYKGIVYHYYCAVDSKGQRRIALATSSDLGKSKIGF